MPLSKRTPLFCLSRLKPQGSLFATPMSLLVSFFLSPSVTPFQDSLYDFCSQSHNSIPHNPAFPQTVVVRRSSCHNRQHDFFPPSPTVKSFTILAPRPTSTFPFSFLPVYTCRSEAKPLCGFALIHTLIPYLVGLAGRYCRQPSLPGKATIASSIEVSRGDEYCM